MNYTGRGPDGEISYENPWFLERDIDFRAALGLSLKDLIGYSIQKYYARIRFTKTFRKGIQTTAFLEAKEANVTSIVITPESLAGPTDLSTDYFGTHTNTRFPGQPNQPAQRLGGRRLRHPFPRASMEVPASPALPADIRLTSASGKLYSHSAPDWVTSMPSKARPEFRSTNDSSTAVRQRFEASTRLN